MLTPVRVTHTLRTFDEQMHLYQQGRKLVADEWVIAEPAHIVTRARPGESAHNFGAAFDICVQGPHPYPDDPALWEMYGHLGEGLGLVWGGRWPTLKDRPHFERSNWRALRDGAHAA